VGCNGLKLLATGQPLSYRFQRTEDEKNMRAFDQAGLNVSSQ
jgi:hypothetical protein